MAEALITSMRGDEWEAFSAGTHPSGYVHPHAITVLTELGIDIVKRGARSKSVGEFRDVPFDLVITVCDDAAEECPVWLGPGRRVHVGFPDPAKGSIEDFRTVRDGIKSRIIPLLDSFEIQSS